MKTIEEAVNAVHKLMYQRTVLNVLITESLCRRLSVAIIENGDPQTEECTIDAFCSALTKCCIRPFILGNASQVCTVEGNPNLDIHE